MFQSLVRVDWLWNKLSGLTWGALSQCFNPSCGLIGCGTATFVASDAGSIMFQSLVRVDWLWNDVVNLALRLLSKFQFLVRVDWLWNLLPFPPLGQQRISFNPSCGLIGCGTSN